MKRFSIEFYGRGRYVQSVTVLAKNKTDALVKLRNSGNPVYEIISVRNLDFPD